MDLSKPSTRHLAEVLCHCGGAEAGHRLDDPACTETVKAGRYTRPDVPGYGRGRYDPLRVPAAAIRGTCPACGRTGVRVDAPTRHAIGPEERVGASRRGGKGLPLGVELGVAAHRTPGKGGASCDGAGRPPVETRFTPGGELAGWLRDYGREHVA